MSHVAYDLQLSDAMNDLQEQVKVENAPTDKNEHGVEVSWRNWLIKCAAAFVECWTSKMQLQVITKQSFIIVWASSYD